MDQKSIWSVYNYEKRLLCLKDSIGTKKLELYTSVKDECTNTQCESETEIEKQKLI